MGRHKRFVDNFWDEDLTNTNGFDALVQRMREGRKLCKDIEEYLKQRSKIETQYVKDLQKLNKQDHKENTGKLEIAWQELKLQTENIAHAHDVAGKQFLKLSNEVSTFNMEQKKIHKEWEDKVSKLHSTAKSTYIKVNNQQKVYQTKFDENTTTQSTLKYNEKHVDSITPKEMDKARSRADKAKDDMEKADNLYANLVKQVQEEMSNWEKEMTSLCIKFQDLDEKRIDHMRDFLWKCTNIDSQASVDHDQCCEHVRVVLENCNIDDDIDHFISKAATGSKRPVPVEYNGHSLSHRKAAATPPKDAGRFGRLPSLPKQTGGHIYADVD